MSALKVHSVRSDEVQSTSPSCQAVTCSMSGCCLRAINKHVGSGVASWTVLRYHLLKSPAHVHAVFNNFTVHRPEFTNVCTVFDFSSPVFLCCLTVLSWRFYVQVFELRFFLGRSPWWLFVLWQQRTERLSCCHGRRLRLPAPQLCDSLRRTGLRSWKIARYH